MRRADLLDGQIDAGLVGERNTVMLRGELAVPRLQALEIRCGIGQAVRMVDAECAEATLCGEL